MRVNRCRAIVGKSMWDHSKVLCNRKTFYEKCVIHELKEARVEQASGLAEMLAGIYGSKPKATS